MRQRTGDAAQRDEAAKGAGQEAEVDATATTTTASAASAAQGSPDDVQDDDTQVISVSVVSELLANSAPTPAPDAKPGSKPQPDSDSKPLSEPVSKPLSEPGKSEPEEPAPTPEAGGSGAEPGTGSRTAPEPEPRAQHASDLDSMSDLEWYEATAPRRYVRQVLATREPIEPDTAPHPEAGMRPARGNPATSGSPMGAPGKGKSAKSRPGKGGAGRSGPAKGGAGKGGTGSVVPATTSGAKASANGGAARQAPAAATSPVARLVASAATWLPPLLTVEGLVMYVLAMRVPYGPMRGVDLDKIDGLGLISVLPVTAFAAIALIIVSFFVTLTQNTDRKGLLLLQLGAITFTLHGAAALIEPEPRFHTAWVHAGFAEYIGRVGEALPGLDARFAWPGFFALFGFVLRAAGIDDPSLVLKWTPFLSNLLYLLPFVLILRRLVATTRARWFAALLFVLVQWIGQDYFSPQGFTYALYLVFIAILMRWFGRAEPRTAPLPAKGFLRRTLARLDGLAPGELPARPTTVTDRVVLLTLVVGIFVATTATHQITPFMMLGALTGLILLRRSTLSLALPVFFGLIVIAWINYQATPFWSGRIDELFGGIGKIFANLQENTGDRLAGTNPQHAIVLKVRLAICGVILAFAATGLLRRLRRGVGDRSALVLLCVPVLALGLQSYGGEIGLRVYMFALPAACILGAYAFFPNLPAHTADAREGETVPIGRRSLRPSPGTTRKISAVLAAGTALVLAVAFLVARYGNEKFERVTTGEAAAMDYVYAHDRPSARLLYLVPVIGEEVTPTIPWRERDIDRVEYDQALVTKNPEDLSGVLTALRSKAANTFVITSRGQAAYLELNHGFSSDWGKRFRAALEASTSLKRVYSNADAAIYTLRSYPRGAEIPPPTAMTLVGDRSTPWTPLGLVALALAVATLFAAELARLRAPDRASSGRRRLMVVGLLMTAAALAVVVERFLTLTSF
ncbi:hypothetical protein [Sphaerisporangium sp. NPDC051011]|uniref:hypothetical protein n=1 Tax=Sphaerisporangium sp. NPDC051011 TaxID=3155792 RepID=UPI00340EE46A